MQTLANQKLITCILPKGKGHDLVLRLKRELGILTANLNSARGGGRSFTAEHTSGAQTEKDLLNVVVPAERLDEIFAWLFEAAAIGEPHNGLLFVTPLARATHYTLPSLLDEK